MADILCRLVSPFLCRTLTALHSCRLVAGISSFQMWALVYAPPPHPPRANGLNHHLARPVQKWLLPRKVHVGFLLTTCSSYF